MMKRRILIGLLLVIIGLPLLGYIGATIAGGFARDLQSVDATAVALPPVAAISPSNNAYTELLEASEQLYYPSADGRSTLPAVRQALNGTGWDTETLRDILDKNADSLALFSAASSKTFRDPDLLDPARVDLNALLSKNFSAYRLLAEVQGVAALAGQETDASVAAALSVIKLGQAMESSYGPLIHYLVAQRIKELGVDVLSRVVAKARPSAGALQQTVDALAMSYDRGAHVVQALKFESALLRNTVVSHEDKIMMGEVTFGPVLARLFAENSYYYQPKRTEQLSIDWYAKLISTIGSSCSVQVPVWQELAPRSVLVRLWTPNAIGRSSLDTGAISFDGLQKRWCSLDAKIEALASSLKT